MNEFSEAEADVTDPTTSTLHKRKYWDSNLKTHLLLLEQRVPMKPGTEQNKINWGAYFKEVMYPQKYFTLNLIINEIFLLNHYSLVGFINGRLLYLGNHHHHNHK